MRIAFTEPEEWLEELSECVEDGEEITCVRVAIEKVPGDSGQETVLLFGTFMTEELLMELVTLCGVNQTHFPEGTKRADEVKEQIGELCSNLGIKLRGGRIDFQA